VTFNRAAKDFGFKCSALDFEAMYTIDIRGRMGERSVRPALPDGARAGDGHDGRKRGAPCAGRGRNGSALPRFQSAQGRSREARNALDAQEPALKSHDETQIMSSLKALIAATVLVATAAATAAEYPSST